MKVPEKLGASNGVRPLRKVQILKCEIRIVPGVGAGTRVVSIGSSNQCFSCAQIS